jgi:RHS repeat-associated protein
MTRPNGVTTNYTYDSLSRLLSVLHQAGGSTIDGATYTVDAAGNRTAKTNQLAGVTSNYTYDPIYELTQVTQAETTTESYSYDPVGNRTASLGVSSYATNPSDELTATPSASYAYDNNGNTTSKTDSTGTTSSTWDYENRLTGVTLPGAGGTVTFKYDPLGRRIYKQSPSATSIFAYDGDSLVETVNSIGTIVARYTQGQNIDEPLAELQSSGTSYYEADALGSITSLTTSAGAVANTYTYDSFGNVANSTGAVGNPFRYTGREFDSEANLYFYRARYYDSNVGRFLSEDPIGFGGGINLYGYVLNSPANLIDPLGQAGIEPASPEDLADLANMFPSSHQDAPGGAATITIPMSCDDVMKQFDQSTYYMTQNNFSSVFPIFNHLLFHSPEHQGGQEVHGLDGLHFRVVSLPCGKCQLDEFHVDPHNPLFSPISHVLFDYLPWKVGQLVQDAGEVGPSGLPTKPLGVYP